MVSFLRLALALPLLAFANYAERGKKNHFCLQKKLLKDIILLSVTLTATPIFLFWSYDYISSALSTTFICWNMQNLKVYSHREK